MADGGPLVLVVEDDDTARSLRGRQLEQAGCRAIAVSTSDEAMREVWSSPLLAGVLTDINLTRGTDDKSGIALARYLREHRPTLPVAGYSGVFAEGRLSDADLALFNLYCGAGAASTAEIRAAIVSFAALAEAYEKERKACVEQRLDELLLTNQVDHAAFAAFRSLICDRNLEVEQLLSEVPMYPYFLQPGEIPELFTPSHSPRLRLRVAILVWMREGPDFVEAEVHGVPELYAYGKSREEALAAVLELAISDYRDLLGRSNLGGPLHRLAEFLAGIFDDSEVSQHTTSSS